MILTMKISHMIMSTSAPMQPAHVLPGLVSGIAFGQNVTRLTPGSYELTVACGLYVDYRYFPQDVLMQVELRDGHVYHLRADPQGRRCQPYLEDAADTKRR